MKRIKDLLETLQLEKQMSLEGIPNVDLYVDQVVQLFENNYNMTTRNEDEKVLTKTMINNYAKGKLFFPIKNKKYSRDHIILISLIYQLKGALSINDIKASLDEINKKIMKDNDFELGSLYQSYLRLTEKNVENFKNEIELRIDEVKEESSAFQDENIEKFLLLASLVNISNLYRRLAEKIVDDIELS